MTHLRRSQLPQGTFIRSSKTAFIYCIILCHNIYILFIEVSANKCNQMVYWNDVCWFVIHKPIHSVVSFIGMSSFKVDSRGFDTCGQKVVGRFFSP